MESNDIHSKPMCGSLRVLLIFVAAISVAATVVSADDPRQKRGETQQLRTVDAILANVTERLKAYDCIHVRATLNNSSSGLVAGEANRIGADCLMHADGRFRTIVSQPGRELFGVAFDGTSRWEWDIEGRRWTRYPGAAAGATVSPFRLIHNSAGGPPVNWAFSRLGFSWISLNGNAYCESIRHAANRSDKSETRRATREGNTFDVINIQARKTNGTMSMRQTISIFLDAKTGLPTREENETKVTSAFIPVGGESQLLEITAFEIDPKYGESDFTYKAADGMEYVESEALDPMRRFIGQDVPEWKLSTLDGKPISLKKDSADRPLVVVVWATYCMPCKQELRELMELQKSEKERFSVVAVCTDAERAALVRFLKKNPIPFVVAHSPEFLSLVQLDGVPNTFVLLNGKIVFAQVGWGDGCLARLREAILEPSESNTTNDTTNKKLP